jgi:hypothetical protein
MSQEKTGSKHVDLETILSLKTPLSISNPERILKQLFLTFDVEVV